jgi:hypothetical protein
MRGRVQQFVLTALALLGLLLPRALPARESGTSLVSSSENPPPTGGNVVAQIGNHELRIEFDHHLRSRVVARFGNREITTGPFVWSETASGKEQEWRDFPKRPEP